MLMTNTTRGPWWPLSHTWKRYNI